MPPIPPSLVLGALALAVLVVSHLLAYGYGRAKEHAAVEEWLRDAQQDAQKAVQNEPRPPDHGSALDAM